MKLILWTGRETDLVDMRQDTTSRDRGPNEQVELFVTSDSQLKVSRRYSLDLQVFRSIAWNRTLVRQYVVLHESHTGQLQNFSREVFHDGSHVYCCLGSNSHIVGVLTS